jgi:AraC family transcriptional regulator
MAWQALRRSGRLPLHARDYKDPLSVSALKSVLDFVYAHVGEPSLRCAVLADVAGLPVDVFRDRFKRSIQRSVYQFVLDVRMECAVDQLLSTSKPIGQIAMDTGFADHSHFGKTFRSRLGQSPGDFRLARNSARTPPGYLEPIPQCKASITTGFPERYSVST